MTAVRGSEVAERPVFTIDHTFNGLTVTNLPFAVPFRHPGRKPVAGSILGPRAGRARLAPVTNYAATAQRQNCPAWWRQWPAHHHAALPSTSNVMFRSRTVDCDAKGRNFQSACRRESNFLGKIHK
jgi:hypothetical protein